MTAVSGFTWTNSPFVFAACRPVVVRTPKRHLTELRDRAELLDLDVDAFLSLLPQVPERVRGEISSVEVINGSPLVQLRSWREPVHLNGHPFRRLAYETVVWCRRGGRSLSGRRTVSTAPAGR